jgi:plastocyanin
MPSFMRRFLLLVASLALPVVLYACASDDDTPPGPKNLGGVDSSTPTDGGVDSPAETAADAPIDQATPNPLRCTQAQFDAPAGAAGGDHTAVASPIPVTFPLVPDAAQYTKNCIKVKVGATVTFAGNFVDHPLEPNGGDVPTPIPVQSTEPDGGLVTITMTKAGTYGYQCDFHPSSMFGAIQVVP